MRFITALLLAIFDFHTILFCGFIIFVGLLFVRFNIRSTLDHGVFPYNHNNTPIQILLHFYVDKICALHMSYVDDFIVFRKLTNTINKGLGDSFVVYY